ncbi:hypothetical protein R6Q57_026407 [Mikania cordata]
MDGIDNTDRISNETEDEIPQLHRRRGRPRLADIRVVPTSSMIVNLELSASTTESGSERENETYRQHRRRGRPRLADTHVGFNSVDLRSQRIRIGDREHVNYVTPMNSSLLSVSKNTSSINSRASTSNLQVDNGAENETTQPHRHRGRPRLQDRQVGFNNPNISTQRSHIDAIGILRVWGPIVDKSRLGQSCNREVRNMVISNESGLEVSVSLWGKLARQHTDDDLRAYGDGNVVLILTSYKVQLFKDIFYFKKIREPCLTSTVSSQLYFNLAIPIIETYKSMYVPPPVVFKSHEHHSEDLCVTKVAELFTYLQEGVIEGTMYIIDATIVDVDLVNDWKYAKCSRCRKKTTLNGDRYFCASCDTLVVNPSQAYKLVIRVVDKGEELSCVLFDEAAFSFLGITAYELLTRSFSELTVTNDEHDVSSQGAYGNIDADTATPSSFVGKAKVEEHVSPYKLRPKKTIKKPKKLKN